MVETAANASPGDIPEDFPALQDHVHRIPNGVIVLECLNVAGGVTRLIAISPMLVILAISGPAEHSCDE